MVVSLACGDHTSTNEREQRQLVRFRARHVKGREDVAPKENSPT